MQGDLPLPVVLLIVFGSAKLMGEIFVKLHQPALVGEILAGALIGPSVLGWIAPHDTLNALSDLGVMFLLFDTGLQVKASELLRAGGTAALAAALGVVATLFGGWGILRVWGSSPMEAIFVATALAATSVGITASALSARGLLHQAASRIILAAAVIDDVLGLIVLAVVSGMSRGRINVLDIALTGVLAAAFTVVAAKWGAPTASRILPHFHSRAQAEEAKFHISLLLLFALSALAVYSGVAAIVGAFLAGLALSESADRRVRDLTRGVSELLVPFFLAGIGLRLDIGLFRSKSIIGLAVLLLATVIVTKLVGCGLGALSLGWRNALKIGLGMVPRGEVTMVIAQMGLSLAVIRAELYGAVVFVAVASALLTPWLLKIAFRAPALEKAEA
ncbi:MAG TPA: cation:proton antiporter [Bryobacteraceae bacterium]|nr:cation:proton antiporter [Bryobacteraceae bacterium]